jgi:hypothetical protein
VGEVMIGLNLKLMAGLLAAAATASGLSYIKGRWDGHTSAVASARIEAVREASRRIVTMEKNNAEFRSLPVGELCRALAADSGLPAGSCD